LNVSLKFLVLQAKFNKTYSTRNEENVAFTNFKNERLVIIDKNQQFSEGALGYSCRPNQMMDKTIEELIATRTGFKLPSAEVLESPMPSLIGHSMGKRSIDPSLPASFDYRDLGWITPEVFDQGRI